MAEPNPGSLPSSELDHAHRVTLLRRSGGPPLLCIRYLGTSTTSSWDAAAGLSTIA